MTWSVCFPSVVLVQLVDCRKPFRVWTRLVAHPIRLIESLHLGGIRRVLVVTSTRCRLRFADLTYWGIKGPIIVFLGWKYIPRARTLFVPTALSCSEERAHQCTKCTKAMSASALSALCTRLLVLQRRLNANRHNVKTISLHSQLPLAR